MELEPFSFYLSAWEEDRHTIAQANIELDEKLNIVQNIVDARTAGQLCAGQQGDVDYVDVCPKQLVSWRLRWCRSWSTTMPTAR